MQVGSSIRIHGLVTRTDLNGKAGRLLLHDPAADRWAVQVGREQVRVKVANVSPLTQIRKTILSPSGAFELGFDAFAAEMYRANLGDTRRDVEESLHAGIYVGLNVSFFYDGPSEGGPMCCVFVGDDEWADECARMQSVNGLRMETFEQDKPLPQDRFFPLAARDKTECTMTSPPRVSYYAFVKTEHSNPCALLLPMLLTDTVYDADDVVAIYARLQL